MKGQCLSKFFWPVCLFLLIFNLSVSSTGSTTASSVTSSIVKSTARSTANSTGKSTAKTVELSPSSDQDLNTGLIAAALKKLSAGDTLVLKAGKYLEETLDIYKAVRIQAEKGAILQHLGSGDSIIIHTSHVTIDGLTIQDSGKSSYQDFAAILVKDTEKVVLKNNTILNSQYGILLNNSKFCVIENNLIRTESTPTSLLGDGIHLWKSTDNQVINNTVHGHRDGIYLEFAKNGYIEGNQIYKNIRYGLHFMFSNGNEFRKNLFSDNDAGVAVMYSQNITMVGNIFSKNHGMASFGLLLKDIMDSRIEDNQFLENTVAIFMEGSNRNKFNRNTFDKNIWAVRILSSCDSNVFKNNSFLNNLNEVASNGVQSENEVQENFWIKHSAVDLNTDGFADLSYQPTSFSSYLLEKYNTAILLTGSPLLQFMDWLERVIPSISPISLRDERPLLNNSL